MSKIATEVPVVNEYFNPPLEVPPKKFPGLYSAGELVRMKFPEPPPATDRTISLIHEASQKLNQRISRYPNCPQCNKRVGVKSGFICVDWSSYRADLATWHYGHVGCTPDSPYDFRLADFRTLRDVLDWTCHLGQKNWFDGGSWLPSKTNATKPFLFTRSHPKNVILRLARMNTETSFLVVFAVVAFNCSVISSSAALVSFLGK